jgi:hypothetical protein
LVTVNEAIFPKGLPAVSRVFPVDELYEMLNMEPLVTFEERGTVQVAVPRPVGSPLISAPVNRLVQ